MHKKVVYYAKPSQDMSFGAAIALSVLLDLHSYSDSNEDFAGMGFRPSWKVV